MAIAQSKIVKTREQNKEILKSDLLEKEQVDKAEARNYVNEINALFALTSKKII